MTSGTHALFLSIAASWLGACQSGGEPFPLSGDVVASVSICDSQCDAQQAVPSCTTLLNLASCQALCSQVASSLPPGCGDEYNAYFSCVEAVGFVCVGGFANPANNACDAPLAALEACQKGGTAAAGSGGTSPACSGANGDGQCPEVPCSCPAAVILVTGSDTTANGCTCWNTITCQAHACL